MGGIKSTVFNPYSNKSIRHNTTVSKTGVVRTNGFTKAKIHAKYEKCFDSDGFIVDRLGEKYWDKLSEIMLLKTVQYNKKCCGEPECVICGDINLRQFKFVGRNIVGLSNKEKEELRNECRKTGQGNKGETQYRN